MQMIHMYLVSVCSKLERDRKHESCFLLYLHILRPVSSECLLFVVYTLEKLRTRNPQVPTRMIRQVYPVSVSRKDSHAMDDETF